MNFSNYQDIVEFAIKKEEEAIKAYGDMIEKAHLPGMKDLLEELRDDEVQHKELLEGSSKKEIHDHEIHDVQDLKISDYLVDEDLNPDISFQDLLIYAAKEEQKAIELYSDFHQKVKNPELKQLVEFLIEQEKLHKLKLETEYEKHVLQED